MEHGPGPEIRRYPTSGGCQTLIGFDDLPYGIFMSRIVRTFPCGGSLIQFSSCFGCWQSWLWRKQSSGAHTPSGSRPSAGRRRDQHSRRHDRSKRNHGAGYHGDRLSTPTLAFGKAHRGFLVDEKAADQSVGALGAPFPGIAAEDQKLPGVRRRRGLAMEGLRGVMAHVVLLAELIWAVPHKSSMRIAGQSHKSRAPFLFFRQAFHMEF